MNTKKLNRGFLLTGVIVLAVAVYLTVVLIYRAFEKPFVFQALENCLSAQIEASQLPYDFSSMDNDEYERYKSEKLSAVRECFDEGESADRQFLMLEKKLDSQYSGAEPAVSDLKFRLIGEPVVDSYANGQIQVSVEISITGKINGETINPFLNYSYTLKKSDGKYLVVDSDFQPSHMY